MKKQIHILFLFCLMLQFAAIGQGGPGPYCNGSYLSGNCNQGGPSNQPGNSVNDFIDIFQTSGGNVNINNSGSGCNGQANNYANYCQHYLQVNPGQVITCTLQSGITYPQGFSIWVDWNQDNTFQNPAEQVAATSNVPAAATPTVLTFTIPASTPNGVYRMRVRCAYATNGTNITPCGTFGYGETEDYTIYVGPLPANIGVPSGTAAVSNTAICVGQTMSFSVNTTYSAALSYTWFGPASYSSTAIYPYIFNAQTSATGVYTVIISNSSCPITRTVAALVVPFPTLVISPASFTICQGGSFTASVTPNGSSSQYSYNWQSTAPGLIFNPQLQSTYVTPSLLPPTVSVSTNVYSVTVTPTIHACPTTTFMTLTINNPLSPTLNLPGPLCNNSTPVQLSAAPGQGTWSASPAISPGGFYSPNLATKFIDTVQYIVAIGNCVAQSSGTISVSKFHTAALTNSISSRCVQDAPFYLKSIVQDTATGNWSGTGVVNNFFYPANLATGNYVLTYNSPSFPNPNVCPSSTSISVPVFNPPTPTIFPIAPRCNINPTVQLSANPTGGQWSGNTGVSFSGVQTPSNNANGINTVTYTAGQGTCVASSSRTFEVSRFNTAALSGAIQPLCVNNSAFNLTSIVQNTNGTWSGTGVSNGAFSPAGLPTAVYTLTYNTFSTPNAGLCPDVRTINASVLNPPTPSIQVVGPVCSSAGAVQLMALPNVGYWVPSSYVSATGMFDPSLAAVGNNAVQYVIGTATCNMQQTNFISVEAFVPATVIQPLRDLCNTSPVVNLSPYVASNTGNWSGAGISGNNFNPAASGAGRFNLIYNTASIPSGLCPDVDTLAVTVYSLEAPTINQAGPFCNNAKPIQLRVSPLGGLFKGSNTNALSNSGIFNPALGVLGSNLISYSISSGPCIAFAQSTIMIDEFVSAAIVKQPDAAYCVNHQAFNLNSFVQNLGGTWNGPGLVGSNMFDPLKSNIGAVNVMYYHTQSSSSALLCPDVSSLTIVVKDLPKASIHTSSLTGCAPLTVQFSDEVNKKGASLWTVDDGAKIEGFTTSHTFTHSGTYSVVYNYEDLEAPGCSIQVKLKSPIKVLGQPSADFMVPEEITMNDPQVQLINLSAPLKDNLYLWTISGMEQYTEIHPTIVFPERGTYRVNLLATDINGCQAEVTKYLEVKNEFLVFIPNSFTPNFDGLNDVFKPVFSPFGLDTEGYELTVFDRWGIEIFRSKNYNVGWDGSFMNNGAQLLKQDSYNYQLKYRDLDGQTYLRQGFVQMLK